MSIVDSIIHFVQSNPKKIKAPIGYCPNCWGNQEYGNHFYEAMKNDNVDVNSISEKKGWVLDYADKHLAPIKLTHKDDDVLICNNCKLTYRVADLKEWSIKE